SSRDLQPNILRIIVIVILTCRIKLVSLQNRQGLLAKLIVVSSYLESCSNRDRRSHSFSKCAVWIKEAIVFSTIYYRSPVDVSDFDRSLLRIHCHEEDFSRLENVLTIVLLALWLGH